MTGDGKIICPRSLHILTWNYYMLFHLEVLFNHKTSKLCDFKSNCLLIIDLPRDPTEYGVYKLQS